MKEVTVTIADWSNKSLVNFVLAIKEHCPHGTSYACDGKCLERGGQPIGKCRYFYHGKCYEENIMRMREFGEAAARRKKKKGEK